MSTSERQVDISVSYRIEHETPGHLTLGVFVGRAARPAKGRMTDRRTVRCRACGRLWCGARTPMQCEREQRHKAMIANVVRRAEVGASSRGKAGTLTIRTRTENHGN